LNYTRAAKRRIAYQNRYKFSGGEGSILRPATFALRAVALRAAFGSLHTPSNLFYRFASSPTNNAGEPSTYRTAQPLRSTI